MFEGVINWTLQSLFLILTHLISTRFCPEHVPTITVETPENIFWVVAPYSQVEVYRRFALMTEATSTSETSVNVTRLHGTTTQKSAILIFSAVKKKKKPHLAIISVNVNWITFGVLRVVFYVFDVGIEYLNITVESFGFGVKETSKIIENFSRHICL